MTDHPETEGESPIERALRMKKAALAAKGKSPGGDKHQHRDVSRMPQGASRPAQRK
jgi:hypothetical protein